MGDIKWIDEHQLTLIDEQNNPKYDTFDEYVEANLDSLINHKVENIDETELAEHILDMYQYTNKINIRNLIKRLYDIIFRFIYLKDIQNYYMKVEISECLDQIKNYTINDNAIEFIQKESILEIEHQKSLYKDFYGIKYDIDVSTADILINSYHTEIIKKYAISEEIIL